MSRVLKETGLTLEIYMELENREQKLIDNTISLMQALELSDKKDKDLLEVIEFNLNINKKMMLDKIING